MHGNGVTFIVVATYNERENIETLLAELRDAMPDANVVVVDDNSPDGTGELLDELREHDPLLHAVHREGKLGYASAHIAGMQYALERGADTVVTMDADHSHERRSRGGGAYRVRGSTARRIEALQRDCYRGTGHHVPALLGANHSKGQAGVVVTGPGRSSRGADGAAGRGLESPRHAGFAPTQHLGACGTEAHAGLGRIGASLGEQRQPLEVELHIHDGEAAIGQLGAEARLCGGVSSQE